MWRGFTAIDKFSEQREGWEWDELENNIIGTNLQYETTMYD